MTTDLSREVDLAIEAIRYICVKSNVPETVMGAICHEVREHLAQPEQTINAVGQVDSHLNQPTQSFIGSAPEPVPAAPIQDAPSAGDGEDWIDVDGEPFPLPIKVYEHIAALAAEAERLRTSLSEAERLIARGVDLMTLEQIGQWDGVRLWQETNTGATLSKDKR